MIRPKSLTRISGLFFLVFIALQVQAEGPADITDIIKKSFKVEPGGTLFLDVDQGEIVVEPGSREVLIEISLTVGTEDKETAKRIMDSYKSDFIQRGNDIHVMSRFDSQDRFWHRLREKARMHIRVTARVPERFNIDFKTGFGGVEISNLNGNVSGRTGAGEIVLGRISGQVDINTGTGQVEIAGVTDGLNVRTGAGNIFAKNIRGGAEVQTGAGNIEAEIVDQLLEPSNFTSGAGNVRVSLAKNIRAEIEAFTGMGSASTDFPLKIESRFVRKSFSGPINGGGPLLHLKAGIGNVELRRI